jgi:predicted secreted protein
MIFLLLLMHACTNGESNQQATVFRQQPELKDIKPQRPVQIKLKRNASGSYSWELKGDNADRILEIDNRLKGSLEE